jgi:WD40 repeat protein
MDTRTGQTLSVLSNPDRDLLAARFSPDGRALVLNCRASESIGVLQMARLVDGKPVPPDKWIALTDGTSSAHFPEWTRDGRSVMFISNRDGFYCLWHQRLNRKLSPEGRATPVTHFHTASLNLGRRPLAFTVTETSAIVSLEAARTNLWRTHVVE